MNAKRGDGTGHRQPRGDRRAGEGGRTQGPPRAIETHCRRSARRPRRRSRCRSAPTSPPTSTCRRRRSGAPASSRASRSPTTPGCSTNVRCSSVSGGCAGSRGGEGPSYEELVEIRGPPAAAVLAGPAVHRRHPRACRGGVRVLSRGVGGRRRHRADRAETGCARTIPVHLPASAARPVPVHRRLHPIARAGHRHSARSTCCRSSWSRWVSRSPISPTSCSPRTPTVTTWRCTASACS